MIYFFPKLNQTSTATTAVSNHFKALNVGSSNVKFAQFQVPNLPVGAMASGIRVGVINECAQDDVSPELIAAISGHKMRMISTLWHYLNVIRPMIIPAATVVAGWGNGCHEYGRVDGPSPNPAVFWPALEGLVSLEKPEELTSLVLWIRDTRSSPRLRRGGDLRMFVSDVAATLVMNYEEFCAREEMEVVRKHMRNAMADAKICTLSEAGGTLKRWGALIKAHFDERNLPLMSKSSASGVDRVVLVVQDLMAVVRTFQGGSQRESRQFQASIKELHYHQANKQAVAVVVAVAVAVAVAGPTAAVAVPTVAVPTVAVAAATVAVAVAVATSVATTVAVIVALALAAVAVATVARAVARAVATAAAVAAVVCSNSGSSNNSSQQ